MAQPQPILALPGLEFPNFDFSPPSSAPGEVEATGSSTGPRFTVRGKPLYLGRRELGQGHEHTVQTSSSIWDCAVVLSKYLERECGRDADFLRGKRILELGCGTGLLGISAAILEPCSVTLTDVAPVLAQVRENVEVNRPSFCAGSEATAAPLDWRDREQARGYRGAVDIILAADVVWVLDLVEPFAQTVLDICGEGTVVYFAYQSRSSRADALLSEFLFSKCDVEKVPHSALNPEFMSDKVTVYRLSRFRAS